MSWKVLKVCKSMELIIMAILGQVLMQIIYWYLQNN